MININKKIIVILGPTATGKSNVGVKIAKKINGEILSADSRQVYRGMNLGSGKITKKEMFGIRHYLLDVISPSTKFSVAKWKKLAEKSIDKIFANKHIPIIVGGTGFYIDAITKNISLPEVPPNYKLRKILEKKSADDLFLILEKLSPTRALSIDRFNKVRLIRAIEIAKKLGKVPEQKMLPSKYDFVFIGLDLPDEELKEKISIRLFLRIKIGMVNEVKKLHNNGVSWKRLESFGLEYREIAKFLQSKISKDEMIENIKKETWAFVKRQRTWYKRNKQIKWFNPTDKKLLKKIYAKINPVK